MKKILFGLFIFLLVGCSEEVPTGEREPASGNSPAALAVPGDENHALVFFLDPNGGPCRLQNKILNDMADELKGKVHLRYVSTRVPEDRDYFYTHGIRGLPQLMLVDAEGREINRMPPGVKTAEDIRRLLSGAGAI